MKKCLQIAATIIIFVFNTNTSLANVECPATTIRYLQIEGSVILVYPVGQNWHLLGRVETVGTRERYSALLAAQMSGRK